MSGNAFWLGRTRLVDDNGYPTKQAHLFLAGLTQGNIGVAVNLVVDGNGNATPDLSTGTRFILLLTADATLQLPQNAPGPNANPIDWELIVQQDATGGHSLDLSAYRTQYALSTPQSPAGTESVQRFSTDSILTRIIGAPSVDQLIP